MYVGFCYYCETPILNDWSEEEWRKDQQKQRVESRHPNEFKIIIALKDVYNLWSKLIFYQSQGELVDP